ncbi:hypothetical protein Aam_006_011 [Acidocella aminolytica 101 = DSM 11237]|uniref:Uncharacterized protein n=1 Tax=Acidocella aminolytica 101 = DSM 11237 TaxID=1120923 RepID=A0A0D6PAM0_9PROT|nr:hypothetical protein Aam_006_011 [Acidocella aminolytica 101 = DSM 11237]
MLTTAGATFAARSANAGGKSAACATAAANRNRTENERAKSFMKPTVTSQDDLRKRGMAFYL